MKKSFLSLLLAACMVLSFATVPAFAYDNGSHWIDGHEITAGECGCFTEGGITYHPIEGRTGEVEVVNPAMHPVNGATASTYNGSISIPAEVTYDNTTYKVTRIASAAFGRDTADETESSCLTSVTIPEGVTEIGDDAFTNCIKLSNLTLPSTITTIGSGAFGGCTALKTITIPAGVTNGLVEALTGNSTWQTYYPYNFPYNSNTQEGIKFASGSAYEWVSVSDGTNTATILYNGTTLDGVLTRYDRTTNSIVGDEITSLTIREGTTEIGPYAMAEFEDLTTVTMPSGGTLKTIGEGAFFGCSSLTSIDLSSVETIGAMAFVTTDLTSVNLSSLKTLQTVLDDEEEFSMAFSGESLTTVVFGDIKEIPTDAFFSFEEDSHLTFVMLRNTPPTFAEGSEFSVNNLTVLVPSDAVSSYQSVDQFNDSSKVTVSGYGLTLSDATLKANDTKEFTNDVPTGCTLTVKSADESIAKVEKGEDGKTVTVTGAAPGTTTITAKITLDSVEGYVLAEATATVTVIGEDAQAVPAVDEPKVSVDSSITDETQKNAAETAANSVEAGDTLTAAAMDTANSISASEAETLKTQATTGDNALTPAQGESVTIYAQTYLDIKATGVSTDNNGAINEITLNITPMVQIVASTATNANDIQIKTDNSSEGNAVVVKDATALTINTPAEITVTLPDSFKGETVYIKHVKESTGKTYYYKGTADENGELTFTSQYGFSPFTFSLSNGAVAELDDVGYGSLQDAVDVAKDGDTVKVIDADETAFSATMKNGDSRTITVENGTENAITVTIDGVTKTIAKGGKESFTYTRPSGEPAPRPSYRDTVTIEIGGGEAEARPDEENPNTGAPALVGVLLGAMAAAR